MNSENSDNTARRRRRLMMQQHGGSHAPVSCDGPGEKPCPKFEHGSTALGEDDVEGRDTPLQLDGLPGGLRRLQRIRNSHLGIGLLPPELKHYILQLPQAAARPGPHNTLQVGVSAGCSGSWAGPCLGWAGLVHLSRLGLVNVPLS